MSYNSEFISKMRWGRWVRYHINKAREHWIGCRLGFLQWRISRLQLREWKLIDRRMHFGYLTSNAIWRTDQELKNEIKRANQEVKSV